jgi:predicted unusual protein kinase regulating ubiquinone biosynthesis (AarF/ABC1/UbiB family)
MIILKGLIWLVEKIPSLEYMSLSHAVQQFSSSMENQMDLTQEAENMNRFIDDFKDNNNVEFSQPIDGNPLLT